MEKFSLEEFLAHPEKKVVTRCGCPVRILCTDRIDKYAEEPIVALIKDNDVEFSLCFRTNGMYYADGTMEASYDLFFADEEEPLTELEICLLSWMSGDSAGEIPMERMKEVVKNRAKELLELARKEIENEVPEMEFIPIENTLEYKAGFRAGKTEALKDLPRWESDNLPDGSAALDISALSGFDFIRRAGRIVRISSLEKLPGFKEE